MDRNCVLIANKDLDYCIREFPKKYKGFSENFYVLSYDDFKAKGFVVIDENNNIIDIDKEKNYSLTKSKGMHNAYIALRNCQRNEEAIVSKLAMWMGAVDFKRKSDNVTINSDTLNAGFNASTTINTNIENKTNISSGAKFDASSSSKNNMRDIYQSSLHFTADGSMKKSKEEFEESLKKENINYKLLHPKFVILVENYLDKGIVGVVDYAYQFKSDVYIERSINFMLNYNIQTDVFGQINIEKAISCNYSKENNSREIVTGTLEIKFKK